jgi:plasmid stability protein
MTITVNITAEVQAELARQAAAHGHAIEAYAASLLEEAVHLPVSANRLNQDRLETTLREIAQFSHKIPILPDEAFTRESLYRDHD